MNKICPVLKTIAKVGIGVGVGLVVVGTGLLVGVRLGYREMEITRIDKK